MSRRSRFVGRPAPRSRKIAVTTSTFSCTGVSSTYIDRASSFAACASGTTDTTTRRKRSPRYISITSPSRTVAAGLTRAPLSFTWPPLHISVASPRCLTRQTYLSQRSILIAYNAAMIKADIVNKVAETSEISRVKAAQAVDTVIEGLRNALARGQRIELRGFGVFQVKQRKKGIGRNPKTGVEVKIPPGNTIRFKPGKELRNLL